jgi:hypothetical protein
MTAAGFRKAYKWTSAEEQWTTGYFNVFCYIENKIPKKNISLAASETAEVTSI